MTMLAKLPSAWRECLSDHTLRFVIPKLSAFLEDELQAYQIYPPEDQWFNAFSDLTPAQVKVVIIGQDPYHGAGQGNGLAFSVNDGVKIPPSLMNIYKELASDLNIPLAKTGNLMPWVKQGVLLMNTVLTVRQAAANSHQNQGWEAVTADIIECLGQQTTPLAFVLWGSPAKRFKAKIRSQHLVIESAHPSPLSAHRGFLGSKPFSQINAWLVAQDKMTIEWSLS